MMSTADQPTPQPPAKKGWFGRNWLWFVPTIILLPILVCGGCGLGGFLFVSSQLKGEPYQQALRHVQTHAAVIDRIGEPIEEASILPGGNVSTENDAGDANLHFPVSGPRGTAVVHLQSRRVAGKWQMIVLEATFADGQRVNLLQQDQPVDDELESAPLFNPGATDDEANEGNGNSADSEA